MNQIWEGLWKELAKCWKKAAKWYSCSSFTGLSKSVFWQDLRRNAYIWKLFLQFCPIKIITSTSLLMHCQNCITMHSLLLFLFSVVPGKLFGFIWSISTWSESYYQTYEISVLYSLYLHNVDIAKICSQIKADFEWRKVRSDIIHK